jgi:centrosomal protein CEP78
LYRSRGETPEEDVVLSGICELNLSYNRLGTVFVQDIINFLKNDRWLRSLNLRGNFIDTTGIQLINDILDRNHSIVSLDIRDNPGSDHLLSSSIYSKLLRNIKNVKE